MTDFESKFTFMVTQVYWLYRVFAAAAKSLQSRPTLCDPTDSSPPGSAVPGVLQARTLEWAAIVFRSILINDFRLRRAHSNRTKENFES